MSHVFISYVRENSKAVLGLRDTLASNGVEVWLDRDEIAPGDRWKQEIRRAIESGAFFLACFSAEYSTKSTTYMNEELTIAIEQLRLRPTDRTWFIPAKLTECSMPDRGIGAGETLRDIQWVDLSTDWDVGVKKLLRSLKPSVVESDSDVAKQTRRSSEPDDAIILESLKYTKDRFMNYDGYPSPEFKRAQVARVDAAMDKLRGLNRREPSRSSRSTTISRKSQQRIGRHPRVVKLPQGKGEIAVPEEELLTGKYLRPVGHNHAEVEVNGTVFTVGTGIGYTFGPGTRVVVARWRTGLILAGKA